MITAPRFPLEFAATLILDQKDETVLPKLEATSSNLSLSGVGLGFPGSCPFVLGDQVRVVLSLGETVDESVIRQIEMTAKVVWASNSRCGLEILDMPDNSRSFYESMLTGYQTLFEFCPVAVSKVPLAA